jgi:nucleotide-binding universal stress UspA family protein
MRSAAGDRLLFAPGSRASARGKSSLSPAFHKILVPVDFSPGARAAYDTAVTLARQFAAELLVLHVIEAARVETAAEVLGQQREQALRLLQRKARGRFRAFLPAPPPDLKLRRIVTAGPPFSEIVKLARLERVELIVIGRKGETGELDTIFFGSTAEKVLRMAPCAVLATAPTLPAREVP